MYSEIVKEWHVRRISVFYLGTGLVFTPYLSGSQSLQHKHGNAVTISNTRGDNDSGSFWGVYSDNVLT